MPNALDLAVTPSKTLTQVFFVSTAIHPACSPATQDLIDATRRRNPQNNITGMLLRTDSLYVQIAEGHEEAVDRLMSAIRKDSRHWDIHEWPKRPARHRAFTRWNARQDTQPQVEQLAGVARARQGTLPIKALVAKLQELE